ncbi:hypothetical protein [Pyrodictium delaneyi]|uniref:hypothetical protein n=1 Tax=Pyrodictium delaneyi TaxID=1273541 RepID=UPI001C5B9785|nr:hypothetical protein [Pyrodictium delaneyi]
MTLRAIIEYYRSALMKSRLPAVNFAIHPLSFVFIVYMVSGGKSSPAHLRAQCAAS